MKKKYWLFCLLILLVISFPAALLPREIREPFKLIQARGIVNKDEIGGDVFNVVSFWSDKAARVAQDGSFTTIISNQRPQKISLIDNKKKVRALAIALPEYPDEIIFDAKSTAIAVLFQESNSFRQSSEVEYLCRSFKEKQSFQNLVLFFKSNLKTKALEDLSENEAYADIFGKCNSEILGNDPEMIKSSLQAAEKELQHVLQ